MKGRYKYAMGKVPMATRERERDKVLGEEYKIMTQIQTDTVKTNELCQQIQRSQGGKPRRLNKLFKSLFLEDVMDVRTVSIRTARVSSKGMGGL